MTLKVCIPSSSSSSSSASSSYGFFFPYVVGAMGVAFFYYSNKGNNKKRKTKWALNSARNKKNVYEMSDDEKGSTSGKNEDSTSTADFLVKPICGNKRIAKAKERFLQRVEDRGHSVTEGDYTGKLADLTFFCSKHNRSEIKKAEAYTKLSWGLTCCSPKASVINNALNLLSPNQRSYFSGFIDADGTISATFSPKSDHKYGWEIQVSLIFSQSWKRRWLLIFLQNEIGIGTLNPAKAKREGEVFLRIRNSLNLYPFLCLLIPYLRIKKGQALLAVEILKKSFAGKVSLNNFLEIGVLVEELSSLNDEPKVSRIWSLDVVKASFLEGADLKAYAAASKTDFFDQALWIHCGLNPALVTATDRSLRLRDVPISKMLRAPVDLNKKVFQKQEEEEKLSICIDNLVNEAPETVKSGPLNCLSSEQLNYLAAFVDADGSISAAFVRFENSPFKFKIVARLAISQAWFRKSFVLSLKKEIGVGSVNPVDEKNEGAITYTLSGEMDLIKFLLLLEPFLRIKKQQALLTIQLLQQKRDINDFETFVEVGKFVEKIAYLNDEYGTRIWTFPAVMASFCPNANKNEYTAASKLRPFNRELWIICGLNPVLVKSILKEKL